MSLDDDRNDGNKKLGKAEKGIAFDNHSDSLVAFINDKRSKPYWMDSEENDVFFVNFSIPRCGSIIFAVLSFYRDSLTSL